MDIVATGLGLYTALGPTAPDCWQALVQGKTAIALRQPFSELPPMPLAMVGKYPADPDTLLQAAVEEALKDAGFEPPLQDWGLVVGSSRCYLYRQETMAATDGWLANLPAQLSGQLARQLGITGPVLAPMAACATGVWALFQAYLLLQTERCRRVLVAAVDAPVTPLTLAGFRRMGAMASAGCYPFDCDRNGLVLGEGAAAIVLEAVADQTAPSYGKLLGFGLSNDAYHISSPRPDRAIATARQCLEHSQLAPTQVDHIHTHGTGTQRNDASEAALVAALFPQATVSASKGATGHTLGAAGLISACFSLLSLRRQQPVPCVGLSHPAFDLNFVGPRGGHQPIEHMLCHSFGFGGQNAIVAMAHTGESS